jgi:Holliday junction resolvase RusA-like endonuclease
MTYLKRISRVAADPLLVLEGFDNYCHTLVTIKTGSKYKKEMKEQIRTNLGYWLNNPTLKRIEQAELDFAIVVRVDNRNIHIQDVDNISKIVLDALKKEKGDSRFLFYDDKQIIRLLLYKTKSTNIPRYKTVSLTISFRLHNSNKQMVLIDPGTLVKI